MVQVYDLESKMEKMNDLLGNSSDLLQSLTTPYHTVDQRVVDPKQNLTIEQTTSLGFEGLLI